MIVFSMQVCFGIIRRLINMNEIIIDLMMNTLFIGMPVMIIYGLLKIIFKKEKLEEGATKA